ncbi:MAG: response regulator transcription factor [Phycisphaerales bacterium]
MRTANGNESELDVHAVIDSIPTLSFLDELRSGHQTFALLLLTVQGQIIYANQIAVNGFQGQTIESIAGKWVHDFVPKEWADERVEIFQRAANSPRPVFLLEIIEGLRLYSRISAIDAIIDHQPTKIIFETIEPLISKDIKWLKERKKELGVIDAQCVDLGKLNVLSERELEVLALMGQGMRPKDIAKELCRSVSTINRHRESIGHKLNMTDRAQIVRLATLAILDIDDARKKKFDLNPDSPARARNDHCN